MLVVLALVFGAIIGAAAHFALPLRSLRGVAVGPILGSILGTATWTALTWAGSAPAEPTIWLASIGLPLVLTPVAVVALSRLRQARDARTRTELGIA